MAEPPSWSKVNEAPVFDRSLCGPVVEVLRAFSAEISSKDMFVLASEMGMDVYIPPGDPVLDTTVVAIETLKEKLRRLVDTDALSRRLDPALRFFQMAKELKKGVRLGCWMDADKQGAVVPSSMTVLPMSHNVERTFQYLRDKIGLVMSEGADGPVWPGHRLMYQRINSASNVLVLIVPDVHNTLPIAVDYLRLLLTLQQSSVYQLAIGLEYEKGLFDAARVAAERPDSVAINNLRRLYKDGVDLARLVEREFATQGKREEYCRMNYVIRNAQDLSGCLDVDFIRTVVLSVCFAVFGTDTRYIWPLDGLYALQNEAKENEETAKTAEEAYLWAQKGMEVASKRDQLMVSNLVKRLMQYRKGQPLVVVFRVGAYHVPPVIELLSQKSAASIIGLVSMQYARSLDAILESK